MELSQLTLRSRFELLQFKNNKYLMAYLTIHKLKSDIKKT